MLYVSAILTSNKVAVTDTDDGVTEAITKSDLSKLCIDGLEVKGVDVHCKSGSGVSLLRPFCTINAVSIAPTKNLTKLNVLKGINMEVNDGVLVGIRVTSELSSDVTIRLSDYCSEVANYVMKSFLNNNVNNFSVTFILDDKVKFSRNSFSNSINTKFDLTELSDEAMAYKIYKTLVDYRLSSFEKIIDDRSRYLRCLALTIVSRGHRNLGKSSLDDFATPDEIKYMHDFLVKKYKSFKSLVGAKIELSSSVPVVDDYNKINTNLDYLINRVYKAKSTDDVVLLFIKRYTTLVASKVDCFENFIRFFATASDVEINGNWAKFLELSHNQIKGIFERDYYAILN